jgi:DNA invertase Pin-like site-specific DNA recombinase
MIERTAPDHPMRVTEHVTRPAVPKDAQPAPQSGILIGYARCSTEKQDLTAQRKILRDLGVAEDRVYLDHGLTGRNRSRPGLTTALAALREGDTLVVPKLDRLARSVPDARAIGDSLAGRGVRLSLGGSVYDPSDPMGKCFFNILATFAEFEVDLLRMRTREGMAIARANGRLKGKTPKLKPTQRTVLLKLHAVGEHSIAELAELFSVSRATVYREIARSQSSHRAPNPADVR